CHGWLLGRRRIVEPHQRPSMHVRRQNRKVTTDSMYIEGGVCLPTRHLNVRRLKKIKRGTAGTVGCRGGDVGLNRRRNRRQSTMGCKAASNCDQEFVTRRF